CASQKVRGPMDAEIGAEKHDDEKTVQQRENPQGSRRQEQAGRQGDEQHRMIAGKGTPTIQDGGMKDAGQLKVESDGAQRSFPEGKDYGKHPGKQHPKDGERNGGGDFAPSFQCFGSTPAALKEGDPAK